MSAGWQKQGLIDLIKEKIEGMRGKKSESSATKSCASGP